eukprot:COSAG02_NODE_10899_length_1836_cov_1.079447_2_plen_232_part_01
MVGGRGHRSNAASARAPRWSLHSTDHVKMSEYAAYALRPMVTSPSGQNNVWAGPSGHLSRRDTCPTIVWYNKIFVISLSIVPFCPTHSGSGGACCTPFVIISHARAFTRAHSQSSACTPEILCLGPLRARHSHSIVTFGIDPSCMSTSHLCRTHNTPALESETILTQPGHCLVRYSHTTWARPRPRTHTAGPRGPYIRICSNLSRRYCIHLYISARARRRRRARCPPPPRDV